MFYILNEKEVRDFTEKYLPMWQDDIIKVSRIEYNNISEYLVNDHYLITIYKDRVVEKDLQ